LNSVQLQTFFREEHLTSEYSCCKGDNNKSIACMLSGACISSKST